MLRISTTELAHETVNVHLEGRMVGPWVDEVRGVCAPFVGRRRVIVDVADVSFAGPEGIVLLQDLIRRQVTVINASPFIDQQLRKDDSGPFLEGSSRK